MATATDEAIVILSDDDSDNDDVVLIKEEIEVDCEDVIFLSETKPEPPRPTPTTADSAADSTTEATTEGAREGSEVTATQTGGDQGKTTDSSIGLSRSNSLATCTDQLTLDDSLDLTIPPKHLLTSSLDSPSPLDLSSKCDLDTLNSSNNNSNNTGACPNSQTSSLSESGQPSDPRYSQAADNLVMLLNDSSKWPNPPNYLHSSDSMLNMPSSSGCLPSTDNSSADMNTAVPLCNNSNNDKSCTSSYNAGFSVGQIANWLKSYVSPSTPVSSGDSAYTKVPSFSTSSSTAVSVQNVVSANNISSPVISGSGSSAMDISSSSGQSSPGTGLKTTQNNDTSKGCNSVQDNTVHSNSSFTFGSSSSGSSSPAIGNLPDDPFAAGHLLLSALSGTGSSTQSVTNPGSLSVPSVSCSSVSGTSDIGNPASTSSVPSANALTNSPSSGFPGSWRLFRPSSSRKARRSDEFKRSLSTSDKVCYYNTLTLPLSRKFIKSSSSSNLRSGMKSNPFHLPRGLTRTSLSSSDTGRKSPSSSSPSTSSSPHSPLLSSKLWSRSKAIPLPPPPGKQGSAQSPVKPSISLKIRQQRQQPSSSSPYSFSYPIKAISPKRPAFSLNSNDQHSTPNTSPKVNLKPVVTVPHASSMMTQPAHSVPPKKQRRCYKESKCTSCSAELTDQKSSQCPRGHSTCTKCLEEKVKLVLTGKTKESVKCLNVSCDSYYPISELRESLPPMVVEILEEKLDQEYVNYVVDLMCDPTEEMEEEPYTCTVPEQVSEGRWEDRKYVRRFEDCPGHWEPMDERHVNSKGYVLVSMEPGSTEYGEIVAKFFESMVDHNVEVTSLHRVQNPIQWKYYTVKKSEMIRDSEGFGSVVEGQLFHGTMSSTVEAICRKGFDWRLCGKHGTMYGQGSYFALNAAYSHQYTDLRRVNSSGVGGMIRSTMTVPTPHSMGLASSVPFLFPPQNVNFGQLNIPPTPGTPGSGLSSMQYQPINLSNNFCPNQSVGGASSFQASQNATGGQSASFQQKAPQTGSLSIGTQPGTSSKPVCAHTQCSLNKCYRRKIIPKPLAIKNISGHPSASLGTSMDVSPPIPERKKAKMFFAKVLVGKYTLGQPKYRKPPPLYPNDDPFGKCYDSCVDSELNPKIFVIFDSAQAYPEYVLEYSFVLD